jgi:hypothetical protein
MPIASNPRLAGDRSPMRPRYARVRAEREGPLSSPEGAKMKVGVAGGDGLISSPEGKKVTCTMASLFNYARDRSGPPPEASRGWRLTY